MRGSSFLPPYAGGGGAAPPWGAAPAVGGLGGHGIWPCGAGRFVCARAYARGHFSHRIDSVTVLTLVTQSIARTVEVSELPAAARVVAAVGVVIYM